MHEVKLIFLFAIDAILFLALLFAFRKKLRAFVQPTRSSFLFEMLFLELAILAGCFLVYGYFLFGPNQYLYFDVGGDTVQQYVPFYVDLVHDLRNGIFGLWNFDYGLGASLGITQTWFVDPFNWLLIAAGVFLGDEMVAPFLVIVQVLRLLVLGLLADRLLVFYCRRPISRIMGALLVCFSGFMVWETHYWFGTAFVLLCLALLAFELLAHKRTRPRVVFFSLACAVTLMFSVYTGMMNLMFLFFYALLRLAILRPRFKLKRYLKDVAFIGLVGVSGCLISCIVFIPVAHCLLVDASRINAGPSTLDKALTALVTFCPPNEVLFRLSRFVSNNVLFTLRDQGFGETYFGLQLGGSVLVFVFGLLFCQYALTCKARTYRRVLMLLPVLLVLLYCFNNFLPAMFNVFAETYQRSSYAFILLICIGVAFTIDRVVVPRRMSLPLLLTGTALTALLLLVCLLFATRFSKVMCVGTIFVLLVTAALLFAYQKKGMPNLLLLSLCIVFAFSLLDAFVSVDYRYAYGEENSPIGRTQLDDNPTLRAVEWIKHQDDSLYRIEKTYWDASRIWQLNWIYDYNGITTYNTVLSRGVILFYVNCWPGVDVSGTDLHHLQGFSYDWTHPGILEFLNIRYVLSYGILDEAYLEPVAQFDDVRVYKNTLATSMGYLYGTTITEEGALKLAPEQRGDLIGQALIIPDDMEGLASQVADSTGTLDLEMIAEDHLIGSMQADAAAVAGISVPFNPGWHAYVDGVEVETFAVNFGFIGFSAPAGDHALELRYIPCGTRTGFILTIAGVVLLIVLLIVPHRGKQANSHKTRST